MYEYRNLENVELKDLHESFSKAFLDYEVKIDLPISKFENMLIRRGYKKEISIGAFKEDKLVGLLLNGLRNWDDILTAYDSGTGVIKEYRKQGITTNMVKNAKLSFKEMGAKKWLLEVIQSNKSAFELYKKQGFEITREFDCYKTNKKMYECKFDKKYRVEHIRQIDEDTWKKLSTFWDYKPSWQNSIDSVRAVANGFIYSIIKDEDKIVGYGIIDSKLGDIPQIAVDKNYRNKGIGRTIVTDLIKNTNSKDIRIINIDSKDNNLKNFVTSLGFEHITSQYEMVLDI